MWETIEKKLQHNNNADSLDNKKPPAEISPKIILHKDSKVKN